MRSPGRHPVLRRPPDLLRPSRHRPNRPAMQSGYARQGLANGVHDDEPHTTTGSLGRSSADRTTRRGVSARCVTLRAACASTGSIQSNCPAAPESPRPNPATPTSPSDIALVLAVQRIDDGHRFVASYGIAGLADSRVGAFTGSISSSAGGSVVGPRSVQVDRQAALQKRENRRAMLQAKGRNRLAGAGGPSGHPRDGKRSSGTCKDGGGAAVGRAGVLAAPIHSRSSAAL
jgi:hypothetical protein